MMFLSYKIIIFLSTSHQSQHSPRLLLLAKYPQYNNAITIYQITQSLTNKHATFSLLFLRDIVEKRRKHD